MNQSTQIKKQIFDLYGTFADTFRKLNASSIDGAVITGSGLNASLEAYMPEDVIDTASIAGFPMPGIAGHTTSIRIVNLSGKRILHFTGRCHLYEGFTMRDALAQVGLSALLGARFIILTNAAGGLNPYFVPGDIMVIEETLNLLYRPVHRLMNTASVQPEQDTAIISPKQKIFPAEWKMAITNELIRRSIPHHRGVYCAVTGPTYETPAEARMYRSFGAHAIGMSTVHEAEFAAACGMQVAGCSMITNVLPETLPVHISHNEVVEAAQTGAEKIAAFITSAVVTVGVCS